MPRTNRGRIPAGVYHVWRRTCGPIQMFRDDFDRTMFCRRVERSIATHKWTCVAFVLMSTHFHFIADVPHDVLSRAMQTFFGPYAQEFNRRWGRTGHLRAEPFKLRRIADDGDLQRTARYVARNPVKTGLCAAPQDWYWSSYPASAGYTAQFPFVNDSLLLGSLHEDRTKAQQLLRSIVEPP
jgi:putative transposase